MAHSASQRLERIRSAIDQYQGRLIAFAARITRDLESARKGEASFGKVREWARAGLGQDESGARAEFLQLVDRARVLSRGR